MLTESSRFKKLLDVIGYKEAFHLGPHLRRRPSKFLGLEFYGPFLMAVKHCDQFQAFAPDPVRNDVWGVWHHKFAGSDHPPRPTHFGLCLKQLDRVKNPLRDERRVLFRVGSDMLPE